MKLACAAAMFAKTLHDPENGFKTEQIRQYAEGLSLDSSELIAMLEKYESR
jgi:Ca-activated chloride channel family protein